jgi:predicted alpha/beta-fold hydrolase
VPRVPIVKSLDMKNSFSPVWWLKNPHLQTIWGRLARDRKAVPLEREVLTAADGDEVVLDHLPGAERGLRFLLLHGLEGSSNSVYVQGQLALIRERGYPATVINFRHCAKDPRDFSRTLPNRRPRVYHSGETTDLDLVVRTLQAREPDRTIVAIGASLGGNVLLKYLGEKGEDAGIAAAVAVSVPFDLAAGAYMLDRGIGRFYGSTFLRTLKGKAVGLAQRHPELALDIEAIKRTRTLREFDDVATAPIHGFADANDYYAKSSSLQYLGRIRVPTLCISSEDDPLVPGSMLPKVREMASSSVTVVTTPHGGHVGFVAAAGGLRFRYWAEEQAVEWLVSFRG